MYTSSNPTARGSFIRKASLSSLLLLCLFFAATVLQGAAPAPLQKLTPTPSLSPKASTSHKTQPPTQRIQRARGTRTLSPLPGITLSLQQGRIIDVSFSKSVPNQAKWLGLRGSKYVIGDVDATDVTPLLWRVVRLRLQKSDQSLVKITLLRPLWWLERNQVRRGRRILLSMPELGLHGIASIVGTEACKADSRELPDGMNVVLGTFVHEKADVLDLRFAGNNKPLGVTANHPIFSETRGKFIPAGELKPGEKVRTNGGSSNLQRKRRRIGRHQVYNLEIHRRHQYFVTKAQILVHNTCPPHLSDPNRVPSRFRDEYEDIMLGNGTPNLHGNSQAIFQGRGKHPGWADSTEWLVKPRGVKGQGNQTLNASGDRILIRPNGKAGYTTDHYEKIKDFPTPHYPQQATRRTTIYEKNTY